MEDKSATYEIARHEFTLYEAACLIDGQTPETFDFWIQHMPKPEPDSAQLMARYNVERQEVQAKSAKIAYTSYQTWRVYDYGRTCAKLRQDKRNYNKRR